MSPARKPSALGLRTAVAQPAKDVLREAGQPPPPRPAEVKPVRVTLNMPPELFRQLTRWCDFAADELARPRVSVQDALRAMVWAGVADASPSSPVLAELRRKRED